VNCTGTCTFTFAFTFTFAVAFAGAGAFAFTFTGRLRVRARACDVRGGGAARTAMRSRDRRCLVIVVREIFQLHFGKAREAIELAREGRRLEEAAGAAASRMLVDVTGTHYTLVLEAEYESLAQFEERSRKGMDTPEWKAWYARFVPLVREGRREIFRVVE